MWLDDNITIPKTLVNLMMDGTVTVEFLLTVLYANLHPYRAPEQASEFLGLTVEQHDQIVIPAYHFLQTGQIVTEHGEIAASLAREESPVRSTPNQVTEPRISNQTVEHPLDMDDVIHELFQKYFPNKVTPTTEQNDLLWETSGRDLGLVEDILEIISTSKKKIVAPVAMVLWWLRNKQHDKIREEAEIHRRTVGRSVDVQVSRIQREAEQHLKNLAPPGANEERIRRLQALRGKMSG